MKTFVVAEVGVNHNGDLGLAKALVESAKECGCSAVKFQSYRTETRAAQGSELYDVFKMCEFTYEQQTELKAHADKVGIEFFSTPFDEKMLFFLIERLGLRRVGLSFYDITNIKMLSAVNEYALNLPSLNVILPIGDANYAEINVALQYLQNTSYLTLAAGVPTYPVPEDQVNLSAINTLKHVIHGSRKIGYSDYTNDILAPALSVIAGAIVIEKHFTLDLDNGALDNSISANPEMMKQMVEVIKLHEEMMGDGLLGVRNI